MAALDNLNTEFAVIEALRAALREKDIDIDEPIIADGRLHRYHVAGDHARSRNAWITLHIDDHPVAEFGCNKRYTGQKFPWKMEGMPRLSADERNRLRAESKRRAAEREKERLEREAEASYRATEIYLNAAPVSQESHAYLIAKGVPSNPRLRVGPWTWLNEITGEEVLLTDSALIAPLMGTEGGRIYSLQAIWYDSKGELVKRYLKDGAKIGHFCTIGAAAKNNVTLICEGLATGLSLWQCTGHAVVVAFDAGNLLPVAKAIRAVRPERRLIICADNDRWTERPVLNPGVTLAEAAAVAVAGHVAVPEFFNLDTKPTDFNDLHQLEGESAVRALIDPLTAPIVTAVVPEVVLAETRAELPPATPPRDGDGVGDDRTRNPYFTVLGYNRMRYYIFQHVKKQIEIFTSASMNDGAFISLAPRNWWEMHCPGKSPMSIDKKEAMEFLMRTAEKRGMFKPDMIRGRGAWYDKGRSVYHHGEYLTVDGAQCDTARILSRYVYEMGIALPDPADVPLTQSQGVEILELAHAFRWTMEASAPLLAGWIFLAPLCGALDWRPHIWLTASPGSGKSTIIEKFVSPLLRGFYVKPTGGSSEAGVRQSIECDAMPVIIDEFEQNETPDITRIQSILSLMRQSSTESDAKTLRGTVGGAAMSFQIRSMFLLASIRVGIKHQSDSERVSILTLRPANKDDESSAQWQALKDRLHVIIARDDEINRRLFKRAISMLPITLKNIETFKTAAAKVFRSERYGDQYGTLLAGAYTLANDKPATPDDAEYFINSYAWDEQGTNDNLDEGSQVLAGLLSAMIRTPGNLDLNVHEVLSIACGIYAKGVEMDPTMAHALLARYGMKILGEYLALSNSSNELKKLMAPSSHNTDWRTLMLRVPGADRNDNRAVRLNGMNVKVTRVPLSQIFEQSQRQITPKDPLDDAPGF